MPSTCLLHMQFAVYKTQHPVSTPPTASVLFLFRAAPFVTGLPLEMSTRVQNYSAAASYRPLLFRRLMNHYLRAWVWHGCLVRPFRITHLSRHLEDRLHEVKFYRVKRFLERKGRGVIRNDVIRNVLMDNILRVKGR